MVNDCEFTQTAQASVETLNYIKSSASLHHGLTRKDHKKKPEVNWSTIIENDEWIV